jgi:predicted ATPase
MCEVTFQKIVNLLSQISYEVFVAGSPYHQTAHKIMAFLSFYANMKPQYKLQHSVIYIDIITLLSYYHWYCCCHITTTAAAAYY